MERLQKGRAAILQAKKKPKSIYLGREEYLELIKGFDFIYWEKPLKFMGFDLYEVNIPSHLEITAE